MGVTRVSEEQQSKRREALSRLKAEIREAEALGAERNSSLWKILGPALENSIKANQEQLDKVLDEPTVSAAEELANVKMLRGAIKAYRHIKEAVEVEATIERKRDRVNKLAAEIQQTELEQGI